MVAPPGNQAENGENKPQPVASGETGLLDSLKLASVSKCIISNELRGR